MVANLIGLQHYSIAVYTVTVAVKDYFFTHNLGLSSIQLAKIKNKSNNFKF